MRKQTKLSGIKKGSDLSILQVASATLIKGGNNTLAIKPCIIITDDIAAI